MVVISHSYLYVTPQACGGEMQTQFHTCVWRKTVPHAHLRCWHGCVHKGINAGSWNSLSENNSSQVRTQALQLAQPRWMTCWITRSSPQSVSAVITIWDCTLWKRYDPQRCMAFSSLAFMIEYRPSLNWEERIGVCLIMEQSGDGFAVHWWWFLCSFFGKKRAREERGCFWLTDCEDEDQTSYFSF